MCFVSTTELWPLGHFLFFVIPLGISCPRSGLQGETSFPSSRRSGLQGETSVIAVFVLSYRNRLIRISYNIILIQSLMTQIIGLNDSLRCTFYCLSKILIWLRNITQKEHTSGSSSFFFLPSNLIPSY